jgi:hypothetical protein
MPNTGTNGDGVSGVSPPLPSVSLADHISLVLLDLAGGPVRLNLILKKLNQRGVVITESAVINCMQRKPERFTRSERGMYELVVG